MNMLLVVSMADTIKSDIKDSIERISEIEEIICKLNAEKQSIASDLKYKCSLLNAVVKDEVFNEKIDESVIANHKTLAKCGSSIADKVLQNEGN